MTDVPERFALTIPDNKLSDLRERLARSRFPDQAPGPPWAYGTDVLWMQELVEYWRDRFDWRSQEARCDLTPITLRNRLRTPINHSQAHRPGGPPDTNAAS